MFKCPKCSKVYKNNGKWIKKHLIEVCHVMHLKPVELVEKEDIGLHEIMRRINNLESMVKKAKYGKFTKYSDEPIERMKREQEEKEEEEDPILRQYKNVFRECITELKEVLELRRKKLEEEELLQEVLNL